MTTELVDNGCLGDLELEDLANGELSPEQRSRFVPHLAECSKCANVVGQLLGASAPHPTGLLSGEALQPGQNLGRYLIARSLGRGGMGIVYAAFDPVLERSVALKLLHSNWATNSEMLLVEAKALARLSHPNVVPVFEVGEANDCLFLVMELIDGVTLADWMTEHRRPDEIIRTFIDAGRGLAAAHASNLTHGDFKPSNVLVSKTGRVCVSDFGLVRNNSIWQELNPNQVFPANVQGTLSYLSPEQYSGAPSSPESDQYAFCVALCECLVGDRLFQGHTAAAIADQVLQGLSETGSFARQIPASVRSIVLRGLSKDPRRRWASMTELCQKLEHALGRRRRYLRAGIAIVSAALCAALGMFSVAKPAPCKAHETALSSVWNIDTIQRARAAAASPDSRLGLRAWKTVEENVTQYIAAWQHSHQEACEATRVHRHQTEETLELRMACLDVRASALRAFIHEVTSSESYTSERVIPALYSLPSNDDCSDLTLLRAPFVPPASLEARKTIAERRESIAKARVLRSFSQHERALELVRPFLDSPITPEYGPLAAEVLYELGENERLMDKLASSKEHLTEAVWKAEASGHLSVLVRAAVSLAILDVIQESTPRDAVRWLRHAAAVVERMGSPVSERISLLTGSSEVERGIGNLSEVARHIEEAIALSEQSTGTETLRVLSLLTAQASNEAQRGQLDRTESLANRALELARDLVGEKDTEYARALVILSYADHDRGRYGLEIERSRQAREIFDSVLGPNNLKSAIALCNEANAHMGLGEFAAAETLYRRALDIRLGLQSPSHFDVLTLKFNLANVLYYLKQYPGALEQHLEVLDARRNVLGKSHPDISMSLTSVAACKGELGRWNEAFALYQEAKRLDETIGGKDYPVLAYSLGGLGEAQLKLGRTHEALTSLHAAVDLAQKHQLAPEVVADFKVLQAFATWETGRDREDAVSTVRDCLPILEATKVASTRAEQARDWLLGHDARRSPL